MFRAKRADRIKLLIWDQTGIVLVHKRLEGGKFVWPQVRDGVMRQTLINDDLDAFTVTDRSVLQLPTSWCGELIHLPALVLATTIRS